MGTLGGVASVTLRCHAAEGVTRALAPLHPIGPTGPAHPSGPKGPGKIDPRKA